MKKLWTALAVLLPVTYLFGRWRSPKQTIVVTPPDVHVHHAAPAPPPPASRYARARERLDVNKVWLDPYVVALISGVAASFAIVIAWNSNEINEKQSELLEQQIAIDASQALPVFQIRSEYTKDVDGDIETESIIIENKGGIARNVDIFDFIICTIIIGDDLNYLANVAEDIPVFGYGRSTDVPTSLSSESVIISSSGNVSRFNDFTRYFRSVMEYNEENEDKSFMLTLFLRINYQDYQGNDREEYYGYDIALNTPFDPASIGWEPGRFFAMTADGGKEVVQAYAQEMQDGLTVDLSLLELANEERLVNLRDGILDRWPGYFRNTATPTS